MSLLTAVGEGWNTLVFGSPVIGGIFIIFTFLAYAMKNGWPIEAIIVVVAPLTAVLAFLILPPWIFALLLIAMSIVVFIAVKKLFNM